MSDETQKTAGVSSHESAPKPKRKKQTPAQKRDAERKREERAEAKAERIALGCMNFDSTDAVDEDDIPEFLREHGMTNDVVIEWVAEQAVRNARLNKRVCNRHYVLNCEHRWDEQVSIESLGQEKAYGEVITERDLQMIWVHSPASYRDINTHNRNHTKVTFEEFKKTRLKKVSAYDLQDVVEGVQWHAIHKRWDSDFFIRKKPNELPLNYTQKDLRKALDVQRPDCKRSAKFASRFSYKSTMNIIDLVSWNLVLIEAPILVVSSVQSLAEGFIRKFRSYFLVRNPDDPTFFQAIFPEMCIWKEDKGSSLSFRSPMSRLDIIQPSLTSSSLDSKVVGERAMLLCLDDLIDNFSASNEKTQANTLEKYDLLVELLDPAGYIQVVGTPYKQGDLWETICERAEIPGARNWNITFDPAWTVKKEFRDVPLLQTEEHMVDLNFPEVLTFANLRASLLENAINFKRQKLVQWAEDDDATLRLHFDLEKMQQLVLSPSKVPQFGETYLFLDRAGSSGPYSDLSSVAVIRFAPNVNNITSMYVLEVQADNFDSQTLSETIALLVRKYAANGGLNSLHIEQSNDYETFDVVLKQAFTKFYVGCQIFPRAPRGIRGEKFIKFKALEQVMSSGRLYFQADSEGNRWLDKCFQHFINCDDRGPNSRSTKKKKDDIVDSISLGVPLLNMGFSQEDEEEERKRRDGEIRKAQYQRMFGMSAEFSIAPPATLEIPERRNTPFGIPGLRVPGDNPGNSGASDKQLTWGQIQRRKPIPSR